MFQRTNHDSFQDRLYGRSDIDLDPEFHVLVTDSTKSVVEGSKDGMVSQISTTDSALPPVNMSKQTTEQSIDAVDLINANEDDGLNSPEMIWDTISFDKRKQPSSTPNLENTNMTTPSLMTPTMDLTKNTSRRL